MSLRWSLPLLLGGLAGDNPQAENCAPPARYAAAGCDLLTASDVREIARVRGAAGGRPVAGCLYPITDEGEAQERLRTYGRQADELAGEGVDLLLCVGMPNLAQARLALMGARRTHLPVFITLEFADDRPEDDDRPALLPAVITLQAMGAAAVGLSGPMPPKKMAAWIADALPYAAVPLIVMAGTAQPDGTALSPSRYAQVLEPLLDAGASILGGGRGAAPEHLAVLRGIMDRHPTVASPEIDTDAAASEREAFFLLDDFDPSEPLECDSGLADDLIGLEGCNIARVRIGAPEDIERFLEAAPVSALPLAVCADSAALLDKTLMRYPGRLLVDSLCDIEPPLLEEIAAYYGAIVF